MTSSVLADFFLQKDEVWRRNVEFVRGRNEALGIVPSLAKDDQSTMDRFVSNLCRYAKAYDNLLASTPVGTTRQSNSMRLVRVEITKSAKNVLAGVEEVA